MTSLSMTEMAAKLAQSPDYQVLQRLNPIQDFTPNTASSGVPKHQVCIIDTETTGLDTEQCELIELGYQVVEFDANGQFYRVLCAKNFLNEPEEPIPPEVTQVTHLTDEDVRGHKIPWDEVIADIESVQLCVAHNAGFDRPIVERYADVFKQKVWGCSVRQIKWLELTGVGSRSQEMLCWKLGGFFYDAHRALDDVQALTQLLSQSVGEPPYPVFQALLTAVREQKVLIKATGAPFDLKDALKQRGYRWQPAQRVWQKMLNASESERELTWLKENGVPSPDLKKIKATDTFSKRAER